MARRDRSAPTPAVSLLQRDGAAFVLHPYEVDDDATTYGEAVAAALGVDPWRLFKTLVTIVDGRLTVAVVPVAAALDLKSLATACGGKKAAMAEPAVAERSTGIGHRWHLAARPAHRPADRRRRVRADAGRRCS